MRNWAKTAAAALSVLRICSAYDIVREYSGSSFFDRWDFYGSWDNLTNGGCFMRLSFIIIHGSDSSLR